jgi:glycosyltransferase involved in cell wall biosynthesis
LIGRFETAGMEVRVDEWPKFRIHDRKATKAVLKWAQVVICEWAGPNAVVASRLKSPGQRLIVRLHRMELSHPEWRDIDIEAVDRVVAVGPHYRRQILEVTGWPDDKIMLIPNFVDETALSLPKMEDARFNLGMLGYASQRKRVDLALDVLMRVRAGDARFRLFLKGSDPWSLKWVEDRPEEVAFFARVRHTLDSEPILNGGVIFDPPGPDVGPWLQKIGFVLSTSDDESFHLSPAEGMASGAVPVVGNWPGADEIYAPEWVLDGAATMAKRILAVGAEEESWREAGQRAQQEVLSKYSLDRVAGLWESLITDDK